jgi:hypothetical protein
MARGAAARGKRIAFGDGKKILWDHHSELIFRGKPEYRPARQRGIARSGVDSVLSRQPAL